MQREDPQVLHRRVRVASLTIWPALILYALTGLLWMALHSLVCWSGDEAAAWWCWWAFALPLLPGAAALLSFLTVLATLARLSPALRQPTWAPRVRAGYRALPPERRLDVRRCFFGAATALGWLAGALSYSYLQLTLLAWLIGFVVMAVALLINGLWLRDAEGPPHAFGIEVPPHRRWPVAWYNPVVLFQAAREWATSVDMVRNADPRDEFAGAFQAVDLAPRGVKEFWFDFISDTGDSGNASYTVARAALAPSLEGTPRGELLLLGGDLAYPGAGNIEYAWRFFELYEAARPGEGESRHTVLAIPQNHDWFDSASTFRRYFVDRRRGEFVGAATPQKSTYFAARLPGGWWVLGLDFALGHDIDRGQLEAFRRVIGKETRKDGQPQEPRMAPGAQVILIYPEPYWTEPIDPHARTAYPLRYQRLEADLQDMQMHVRLRLAGDLHHYRREWRADDVLQRMLITCGSGGAFLHPTHARAVSAPKAYESLHNDDAIDPDFRRAELVGGADTLAQQVLDECRTYPDPAVSRRLAWRNVYALFKLANNRLPGDRGEGWAGGNIAFVGVLGLLYWLAVYTNSLAFALPLFGDPPQPNPPPHTLDYGDFLWCWFQALFYSPLSLGVFGLMALLCISVAKDEPSLWVRLGGPALHFAGHVVAAATLFWWLSGWVESTWAHLMLDRCMDGCKWVTTALARNLLMFLCGAVVGGVITGLYFAVMAWFGWLPNNAYSPLAVEDYKGFLRFHIDAAGTLHGRFFACDRVPRRWKKRESATGVPGAARPAWEEESAADRAQWKEVDRFSLERTP